MCSVFVFVILGLWVLEGVEADVGPEEPHANLTLPICPFCLCFCFCFLLVRVFFVIFWFSGGSLGFQETLPPITKQHNQTTISICNVFYFLQRQNRTKEKIKHT